MLACVQYGVPAFKRLRTTLNAMSNDDLKKCMGCITNTKAGILQLIRDYQVRLLLLVIACHCLSYGRLVPLEMRLPASAVMQTMSFSA